MIKISTATIKSITRTLTILEKLNDSDRFKGKVAAFSSWDVFPYIINDKRSGVPVNAGYTLMTDPNASDAELLIQ